MPSLHALYELAARTDCVVDESSPTRSSSILPTQNPDGREDRPRRNLYGFDMNRDWFARTQPETDGKLEVIRAVPADALHRRPRVRPGELLLPAQRRPRVPRDPGHGPRLDQRAVQPGHRRRVRAPRASSTSTARRTTSSRSIFGDTVPTAGFHAAGMTFEKENGDPIAEREHEQFTSIWASLAAGAAARDAVIAGWRASYVEAYAAGRRRRARAERRLRAEARALPAGPGRHGPRTTSCAHDPDRAYELAAARPAAAAHGRRRLPADGAARAGRLPSVRRSGGRDDLPAGTYWIPLAQAQKHWIQAMLHEESWIPFEVTYDVTAWSNPLLMNLRRRLDRRGVDTRRRRSCRRSAEPAWAGARRDRRPSACSRSRTARAASRPPARRKLPVRPGLGPAVRGRDRRRHRRRPASARARRPRHPRRLRELRASRRSARRASGRCATGSTPAAAIVAWQGGARSRRQGRRLDAQARRLADEHARARSSACRSTRRARWPRASATATGSCTRTTRRCSRASARRSRRSRPPATPDYATSGLAIEVDTLAGTSAVVDEAVGAGRVVVVLHRPELPGLDAGHAAAAVERHRRAGSGRLRAAAAGRLEGAGRGREGGADAAAERLPDLGSAIRIRVAGADAAATAKILARHGAEVVRHRRRRRRAVPRRQPRRPVVRRAPVLRARRPRAREGRASTLRAASLP